MRILFIDQLVSCGFGWREQGYDRPDKVAVLVIKEPDAFDDPEIHLECDLTLDVARELFEYFLFVAPHIILICAVKNSVSYSHRKFSVDIALFAELRNGLDLVPGLRLARILIGED